MNMSIDEDYSYERDHTWFVFTETENELKAELDEITMSEQKKDKIIHLLKRLEDLAIEL